MMIRLMQLFLVSVVMFSCVGRVFAGDQKLDSLYRLLHQHVPDTTEMNVYIDLCHYFQEENTDSSFYYAKKGIVLAQQQHDLFRLGRAYHEQGVAYDIGNQLDSCVFYLNKADSLYTVSKHMEWKSAVYGDLGVAYYLRGKYEHALRAYMKSYPLMKQYNSKQDQAKTLNNIGLLYKARKEFERAIDYLQSALQIKREIGDQKGILNTTINIGSMYHQRDMLGSAAFYAGEGLKLAEKLDSKKDILICKINKGAAIQSMGRFEEASALLFPLEKEMNEQGIKLTSFTFWESLANLYAHYNQPQKAIQYYGISLKLATDMHALEAMATYHRCLAKTYSKMNQYQLAYLHSDSSKLFTDSLLRENNLKQMEEMSAVFESNEKELKIRTLQETNALNVSLINTRKKERNYFILSTILFVCLSVLALRAYRNNRRKNALLTEQKSIIEKSLRDKEVLLKEIHHRVKNNLQLVSSLLSLQSNYIEDEKALDVVRESKSRVQAMALIHQNLYQDESLVNIEVSDYIRNLSEYIFKSYNLNAQRIELETKIDAMKLDIDMLIPLGLILNELINNCLKYAFPDNRQGKIKIILQRKEQQLSLGVYDNGVGVENSRLHFEQNSFGHKMIHAFIKKLKGTISIYSEDGTRVDILIPMV